MKLLWRIFNVLLTIATFVFAFFYGNYLLNSTELGFSRREIGYVILSFCIFILFQAVLSYHWMKVSKINSKDVNNLQCLAFFASQPYKYLPTSIFSFSYRAKFAKDLGMSLADSSKAQLNENFNIVVSGVLVILIFSAMYADIIFGMFALGCILLFSKWLKNKHIILKIPRTKMKVFVSKVLPTFWIAFCSWIVAGISFYLAALATRTDMSVFLAITASAAGNVISILAVFSPGGIGVRELTLSVFLIPSTLIVLWRLITFFSDMFTGIVAIYLISRLRS